MTLLYQLSSKHDVTALMSAALGGNASIVAALLDKKARLNVVSDVSLVLMQTQ